MVGFVAFPLPFFAYMTKYEANSQFLRHFSTPIAIHQGNSNIAKNFLLTAFPTLQQWHERMCVLALPSTPDEGPTLNRFSGSSPKGCTKLPLDPKCVKMSSEDDKKFEVIEFSKLPPPPSHALNAVAMANLGGYHYLVFYSTFF
jgi:hypothetical protein